MVYPKKYMFNQTRHGSKIKRSDSGQTRNEGSNNGHVNLGAGQFGFKVRKIKSGHSDASVLEKAKQGKAPFINVTVGTDNCHKGA